MNRCARTRSSSAFAKRARNRSSTSSSSISTEATRSGRGKKSLAFHVVLQSETKTLSDKDEQKFLKRFENLIGQAGGALRTGG